jgi:hypothetical protein
MISKSNQIKVLIKQTKFLIKEVNHSIKEITGKIYRIKAGNQIKKKKIIIINHILAGNFKIMRY